MNNNQNTSLTRVIGIGVIYNNRGEVLIDQRLPKDSFGGMWEFPGGKQEQGEEIKSTVAREIREELAIQVEVGDQLMTFDYSYPGKTLRFVVHVCRWISGEPKPLASQDLRWVNPKHLYKYSFPSANGKIIEAITQSLHSET